MSRSLDYSAMNGGEDGAPRSHAYELGNVRPHRVPLPIPPQPPQQHAPQPHTPHVPNSGTARPPYPFESLSRTLSSPPETTTTTGSRHIPGYGELYPVDAESQFRSTGRMSTSSGIAAGRRPTLTRPERQRSVKRAMLRDPSAGPPAARAGATTHRNALWQMSENAQAAIHEYDEQSSFAWWKWSARIMTCCFLPPCLTACGKRDKAVQQAWREKVALCMIIFFMCALVAFLTVGLQRVLCPESSNSEHIRLIDLQSGAFLGPGTDWVAVGGNQYRFDQLQPILTQQGFTITDDFRGADLTVLFAGETSAVCQKYLGPVDCRLPAAPNLHPTGACADPQLLRGLTKANRFLEWDDLVGYTQPPHTLLGYNGAVLNVTTYLTSPTPSDDPSVVKFRNLLENHRGSDASYTLVRDFEMREAIECLDRRNRVGFIGEDTVGCVAAMVIQTVSLIVILGVVLARFFMAVWFHWWTQHNMSGTSLKPDQMQVSTAAPASQQYNVRRGKLAGDDSDLYTIMLVTCYSEGEHGIRSTLNSLATTTYPDEKKLLFVVADGQIKGSGNDRHTHDIIIDMMNLDPALPDPEPKSYIAIAHGKKQHNMAKVYAGTYEVDGHRVPMITVVKWGTPAEQAHAKPGNRGKRDSQMVLMNFLSRTLFDDRMTSLDYELFYRIQHIATTADEYESILMVDADTKVAPDSLRYMINAMKNDVTIMGLCGETRIGNKTASFTSAIQVFEYYISHHLGKAFESVFGGVTCLPGCFCMYRIKAPKADGQTVPVLVAPSIVEEYSENIVDTLHKKNLLLLGEDRFLTTLMLRNFPHRKMVFVPQAKCWTIVPDEFKVLLSQRRRWINSTVHNLLELVLVRDLCGTFCFSMQFVVLLELIGTIVLPVAICLTLYLIISAIVTHTAELLPFLMLGAILGLPGFLIIITTRKLVYVAWMLVYLVSLPIWNCILPSYAYWHFDDFSWGETRKVEGELKGDDHGKKEGDFDGRAVSMKKWAEWERDRIAIRGGSSKYDISNSGSLSTLLPAHDMSFHTTPLPEGAPKRFSYQRPLAPQDTVVPSQHQHAHRGPGYASGMPMGYGSVRLSPTMIHNLGFPTGYPQPPTPGEDDHSLRTVGSNSALFEGSDIGPRRPRDSHMPPFDEKGKSRN